MALSVGPAAGDDDEVIATINTTPLVDVMLVLLIIFLITIPVVTHTVPVQLPKEQAEPFSAALAQVVIAVDRQGVVYWRDTPVDPRQLLARLQQAAAASPQPAVQLRGDLDAAYGGVGRVLAACRKAGLQNVSLITQPKAQGS